MTTSEKREEAQLLAIKLLAIAASFAAGCLLNYLESISL